MRAKEEITLLSFYINRKILFFDNVLEAQPKSGAFNSYPFVSSMEDGKQKRSRRFPIIE